MNSIPSKARNFLSRETNQLFLALTIPVMGLITIYLNVNTPPPNANGLVELIFYGSYMLQILAVILLSLSQKDLFASNIRKNKFDERELSRRNIVLNRSNFLNFLYLFLLVNLLIYSKPVFFSDSMAALSILILGIALPSIVAVFDKRQQ